MPTKQRKRGFLSWSDSSARLTRPTPDGLRSTDLGRITVTEAEKLAWLHGCVLLVRGRIFRVIK